MSELLHSKILGEGKPLLILHGFLGMGDNWKTLGNVFAEKYQIHLIDQRNHGRSFHDDTFDYEVLVTDLIQYMDHYEIESAYILGHSMGGKTAMLFAVNHPERVEKLIVADISPRYYPPHHQSILEALNAVDFSTIQSRNDVEAVYAQYIDEPGIRQFLMKNVTRVDKTQLGYRFNLESLTENYEEITVGLPSFTQYDGPALFLRGANSGYIGAEDEGLIAAHFENSEIKTVSGAGHWLHADNPKEFSTYVLEFLQR